MTDIISLKQFIQGLTDTVKKDIVQHFDSIYLCSALAEHEEKIIYLAYLWREGLILQDGHGMATIDSRVTDVEDMDYELTFEVEEGNEGGTNLDVTYEYYQLGDLIELIP